MSESAKPESISLPWNVRVLGVASLFNDIASEMIYPVLPFFLINVLGGNKFTLGVVEGCADSVASLLKLWSGGRSDQAGARKGFVVVGYVMTVLIRPLIGIITAPWQLFLIRFSDRLGKGVRSAPRDALIADCTDPAMHGRAFGFNRAMDHLGAAIGPLLMFGLLWLFPEAIKNPSDEGWSPLRLIFLSTVIPGVAVVVLVVFGLREADKSTPAKEKIHLTLAPFDFDFKLFLIALIVFTLGNSSDSFLLVRAGEIGVPTEWLPILWCAFHVVKSVSNLYLGRAVDRVGPKPFLFFGWFVYAAVYLAFALATEAWEAWLFFLCYALFYGLTEPAEKTLVANLVGSERKGLAYGWFNFAVGVATLPASLVFGLLYQQFGALAAFGFSAGCALIAAVLLVAVRTRR